MLHIDIVLTLTVFFQMLAIFSVLHVRFSDVCSYSCFISFSLGDDHRVMMEAVAPPISVVQGCFGFILMMPLV